MITAKVLIVTLVNFSTLTVGKRDTKVIRSRDGDFFTNPAEICDTNSCNRYNLTTVGGHCVSSDECCTQCRCDMHARTYILRRQRCMPLDKIRKCEVTQTTDEIKYSLGEPGKSCSETCNDLGKVCLAKGHGFTDFQTTMSIFSSVNVSCTPGAFNTDQYLYPDQPAYVIESGVEWAGRCIGFKNVPDIINCIAGKSPNIRRLCPCKGYCRYWFVEHSGGPSCNNIPVIDLSAKGSIKLSICKQDNQYSFPQYVHLLKCSVEAVTYMRESQWMPFGDGVTGAFEATEQHSWSIGDGVMLRWNSSLGNNYNGIIGLINVKCEGLAKPVCFIFKSNGNSYNPTSQPFVTTMATTEVKQQLSTPRTATPSRPNATGGFDEKKGGNGNSTTIAAAVTASVVLLIIICALIILVIRRRRRQR